MTLINDRVNLMLVICCSALISCNKVMAVHEVPVEKRMNCCFIAFPGGISVGTFPEATNFSLNFSVGIAIID